LLQLVVNIFGVLSMTRTARLPDNAVRLRQAKGMPVMFKSTSTSLILLGILAVIVGILAFGRLAEAERVVHISAPAGSGKTVLMRSWIAEAGLTRHAAWVPADRGVRDPQSFWISVADALRGTAAGSILVRPLTAAPDLDGWAVVERLLKDLAPLEDRLWLMIDDAHLLASDEVLPQLELLLLRAPQELRFVVATRHDLRLGLRPCTR
jgi:ATP/maltotriose-dependent transcriptional regulator MalT